jgi:hypothetical protein
VVVEFGEIGCRIKGKLERTFLSVFYSLDEIKLG